MSESNKICVDRPNYDQIQFNQEYEYKKPKKTVCEKLRSVIVDCNIKHETFKFIPILKCFSHYDIKQNLVGDILGGITVATLQLPQGIGLALLANVPLINGIYSAFFPVLIYAIFGTSLHLSMGTFSVVNIMLSKIVLEWSDENYDPDINATSVHSPFETMSDEMPKYSPTQVAAAVCFLAALIQLLMWTFRLGVLSSLLCESLVSGLTTGAAIHVITSQIKYLLGVRLGRIDKNFQVILTYTAIVQQILNGNFNWVPFVMSSVSIIILFVNTQWINPAMLKNFSFPLPMEFIVIIVGTMLSNYFTLSDYGIRLVGHIPVGFPEIELPPFELIPHIIGDTIEIAMVSYTISVSLALVYAQKYNYEIDFNQELLAMGSANAVGSLFSCMPISASFSRSFIQEAVGGKTQVTSLISCGLMVIVLLWVGPFFEPLPKCIIASVIIVALKGVLMNITEFYKFWKLSQLDGVVWMITFLAVVFVAIDIGLAVGITISLVAIFIREMRPYTCRLGNLPTTDLYIDMTRYREAKELDQIKIFHYSGSLNFVSRLYFRDRLCRTIGINLEGEITKKRSCADYIPLPVKSVIVDFSALSYIDPSGVSGLKLLVDDFGKLSINFFIASASSQAFGVMTKCGLLKEDCEAFKFFPTIHDAVHYAQNLHLAENVIDLGRF